MSAGGLSVFRYLFSGVVFCTNTVIAVKCRKIATINGAKLVRNCY